MSILRHCTGTALEKDEDLVECLLWDLAEDPGALFQMAAG